MSAIISKEEMESRFNDRIGSKKQELLSMIDEQDSQMAEMFKNQSESSKNWGRLIGRLLKDGKGNESVEKIFGWWEHEFNNGEVLTNQQKATAFFHCIGSLSMDDFGYRKLRKLFVTANQEL